MLARDLHLLLAGLTLVALLGATAEGARRAITGKPTGSAAVRTRSATLVAVGATAAGGIALVLTGHHPNEWLHVIYAVLAFGLIPVADNVANEFDSNRGKGLTRLGGGLAALVVLLRLFATG